MEIDWQALLHPSACPQTSTVASSAAKDCSQENDLTAARDPDPPHDGRSNRRSFTDEEKLAVVLESEQPGMSVAEACRHRIVTSMVFRWRVQFAFAGKKAAKLAKATLVGSGIGGSTPPAVLNDLLHPPDGMMPVQLPDRRRVVAPEGSDPAPERLIAGGLANAGTSHTGAGQQILRSDAALSAVADLCAAWRRSRTLDAGRMGWRRMLVAGSPARAIVQNVFASDYLFAGRTKTGGCGSMPATNGHEAVPRHRRRSICSRRTGKRSDRWRISNGSRASCTSMVTRDSSG